MEKNDKIKRFLSWVNADEGLPNHEEESYSEHDHHDDHSHPHTSEELEGNGESTQKANTDELTEDYEGDDEFEYPDEIASEAEQDAEDALDYADTPPEPTHLMTKKQKLQMKRFRVFYLVLSAILALNVIVVLLITVNHLPPFGATETPAVNEVYVRYIEQGMAETGAPNIVAAILFSYRSFDTLGEALVLFTAAMGVMLLLRETKDEAGQKKKGD